MKASLRFLLRLLGVGLGSFLVATSCASDATRDESGGEAGTSGQPRG